jgi:ribonucleoside-diphosphate reductase alpha chain
MLKIRKITKPEIVPVYDLTVPETSNFVANNIVVHNCTEITLRTDKDRTAVCCLSSLNLDKWDEYKDNYQFFKDIMEMLDNVLQYFIDNAPAEIARAVRTAQEERSVGLGVMGFHSYLQQKEVPFGSVTAKSINKKIFKTIKQHVDQANLDLGTERGSPELLKGTGLRFAHTTSIAPTATNALICANVSPSAEPWRANAFRQDTLSGTFIQKNKYLDELIKHKVADQKLDYDAIWLKIVQDEGSIEGNELFDEHEREVYKSAHEIDMLWAVEHVADRQPYIDQAQSFNIFIKPTIDISRLHAIHFNAWKKGIKSMYYCRSEKLSNTEKVSQKVERVRLDEDESELSNAVDESTCLSCEG